MAQPGAATDHPEARRKMEERDDFTLLDRIAQRRDRAAFAELFSRYQKRAYSLAFHLTRNHDLAQDSVQEAMLDVWLHASSFRPGNAVGWILRIVTNKSITRARQRQMPGKRAFEPESADDVLQSPTPANLIERAEQVRVMREILGQMPLLDLQMLALCYGSGLSQAQIGQAFSLSRMAVSRRLAKACAEIRKQLAQAGYTVALPLVFADGLGEALCSGYESPSGLCEKVMRSLDQPVREGPRAAASRTPPSDAKAGPGVCLALGLVAVFAGGVWIWTRPSAIPTRPSPAASPAPALLPAASRLFSEASNAAPTRLVWSFERGPHQDLRILQGEWRWRQDPKLNRGEMYVPKAASVMLSGLTGSRPVKISGLLNVGGTVGRFSFEACWATEKGYSGNRAWINIYTVSVPGTVQYEIFCFGRHIITRADGHVCLVQEFERPYPGDRVVVNLENCSIFEISREFIGTDGAGTRQIPPELRDVPLLIRKLDRAPRSHPTEPFKPEFFVSTSPPPRP